MGGSGKAKLRDIHDIAAAMPFVSLDESGRVYQVGGKSFVFFRTPRPDAVDPDSGARLHDVIVVWVSDEAQKNALISDPGSPFFTTSHFDGHCSVLLRGSRIAELSREEIQEIIEDAWLCRASKTRAKAWLDEQEEHHG